jgi:hypothetical protein
VRTARPRLGLCGKEGGHEQRAEEGDAANEETDREVEANPYLDEGERVGERGDEGAREDVIALDLKPERLELGELGRAGNEPDTGCCEP